MDLERLDQDLNKFVEAKYLSKIASFGIRGEVIFPTPYIFEANPFLLGYYRLLYGVSQKDFYVHGPFGRFVNLENNGKLPPKRRNEIGPFCDSLINTAIILVDAIEEWTLPMIHELQLLTVGPLLRGRANVRKGQKVTAAVFSFIKDIVSDKIKEEKEKTLLIENDSGREVTIVFSSDPDISITMALESRIEPLISIEIKGGTDHTNVYNRLGEAEKSHLKASKLGFNEFWTLLRVDIDEAKAKAASPTTSLFFHIDRIFSHGSEENIKFKEILGSKLGI